MLEIFKKHILKKLWLKRKTTFLIGIFVILIVLFEHFYISPPRFFPTDSMISIKEGSSLHSISKLLEEEGIIRSASLLQFFTILLKGDQRVLAGDYVFEEELPVFSIARRLTTGDFRVTPVKVTVPEGLTLDEITLILDENLPQFDKDEFSELTQGKEGYLFPDTYLFFPSVSTEKVINEMAGIFENKVSPLEEVIGESGYSKNQIITMASLLEKESRNSEERRVIAGILWKRLEIGLPLQVDASFLYINGKGTFDLTKDDLNIDSPYNTYKYLGLPPTPINNPGLDSIAAALYPEESDYLFYLHGNNGDIYYAADFEGHKRNRWRYLDK